MSEAAEKMTPGMKEIRPGVWQLRVFAGRRPNGSPIQLRKTVTGPERKWGSGVRVAKAELDKMRADAARGIAVTGTETVGDLLDRWLAHCDSLGRSPTTMLKYRSIVKTVVRPELGHLRLSKLTAGHLDALYATLTAKGNKATTVRRVHALIGAALHQAEKWDLVGHNVSKKATPPPVHRAQIESPTPEQVQAILAAAEKIEPTLAALLLLAALTGARRGELCALRWSDVDFSTDTLTIARSVYDVAGGGWAEKTTKTHAARRIGLDPLGMTLLERHREAVQALAASLGLTVPPDAFLFSQSPAGSEPLRPDYVTKFMVRTAKAAGVPIHLHSLRHFSVTEGIAAGGDIRTVAGRHGHADASVTLRTYSHVIEARDRDVAASVGKTLRMPGAPKELTA